MSLFYSMMVALSVLGSLWITLRRQSGDLGARVLTMIVGLAIAGLALSQALQGQSLFANPHPIARFSNLGTVGSSTAAILPEAIRFFLIMAVASLGVFVLCTAGFVFKEGLGVLRTRGPTILLYVCCIGAYLYACLFPMGLVKLDILHLADKTAYEIAVAYVSLIAALIFLATVLALHSDVRRHKAIVAAFFFGCVAAAASSPFVWTVLATAVPAAQPVGVLSIFAMIAPAPAYFLLHYRLGWL